MGYFALESLKSQYEEIQEAVSNTVGGNGKIGNKAGAAGEKERNSMEFFPENDTRIYILSRDREKVSMAG